MPASRSAATDHWAAVTHPRSVVIVGAVEDPARLASRPLQLLELHGFAGDVYVVNPRRESVRGHRSYPSIGDLPEVPDLALIMVGGDKAVATLRECGLKGVPAAIIVTDLPGRTDQLRKIRDEYGIRIIGPNSNGIVSGSGSAVIGMQPNLLHDPVVPGPVGLAFQSGALASTTMRRLGAAGIGFHSAFSCGSEADITACDVASVMLDEPGITTVMMFLEGLEDGTAFIDVARKAARLDKSLVVLKVGRTSRSEAAVAAHTGKLVGSYGAYAGAFHQHGVIDVASLEELVNVAALSLSGRPPAPGVAIVSGSGGLNSLMTDLAAQAGLPVPDLDDDSVRDLTRDLPYAHPANPLDLTGIANEDAQSLDKALRALGHTSSIGTIVVALNVHSEAVLQSRIDSCLAVAPELAQNIVVYAASGALSEDHRQRLRSHEIPVLTDVTHLFGVLNKLHLAHERRARVAAEGAPPQPADLGSVAIDPQGLRSRGLPFVPEVHCTTTEALEEAAADLGWPVAVKIAGEDFIHKTDVGGVILDVGDAPSLLDAWHRIRKAAGDRFAGVVVQPMVPPGVEMLVSGVRDATFGPTVTVGMGGVATELAADVAVRVCPLSPADAHEAVSSLRGHTLLDGFRGAEPADVDALVDVVVKVADLMCETPSLDLIELNPVIVHPVGHGVHIVDLVVDHTD